jgi:hypothetical protein
MGAHDAYGKQVLRAAAGNAFTDWGSSVEIDYGAGSPARIDGTIAGIVAVEVESRTAKQVRGAVLDLVFHRFPKKLLVVVPMHMSDCQVCAQQCQNALGRFLIPADFRVVVLQGTGVDPAMEADIKLVATALSELGVEIAV